MKKMMLIIAAIAVSLSAMAQGTWRNSSNYNSRSNNNRKEFVNKRGHNYRNDKVARFCGQGKTVATRYQVDNIIRSMNNMRREADRLEMAKLSVRNYRLSSMDIDRIAGQLSRSSRKEFFRYLDFMSSGRGYRY